MIIHLKRSIPFRESYVTNLSSYEQIFIDNINGKHEEITDLIKKTQIELFNTSLINIEKQFSKKIYPVYTYIDYSFGDKLINSKEYIDHNINILQKNQELKKEIFDKIIHKIEQEEKIYDTIFKKCFF
jgi:hypothetical protein